MSKKTKTEAKASRAPRTKFNLRDMSQTDGAVRTANTSALQYMTGYDTADASVYLSKIGKMDNSELYDHAIAVGETPIEDTGRLIDRLHVRFLQAQAAVIPRQNIPLNMSPENEAILRKIMGPAR